MTLKIKEHKNEIENKTIRFPIELIDKIEKQLVSKNITFSSSVIQTCRYDFENIEETDIKEKSEK